MRGALVLLALAAAASTAVAESSWYRSNESGERVEEIAQSAIGNHRYVLVVRSDDGAPEAREETLYREGRAIFRRLYDADGSVTATERFSYYADGKLQEVTRRYSDGRVQRSRYEFVQGRLAAEWHMTGSESRLVRYDGRGRLESETRWVEETLVQSVRYAYGGPEDRRADESVTRRTEEDLRIVRRFDEEGRVTEARRSSGEVTISVTTYEYGAHGVVREHEAGESGSRTVEYEYDEEGERALRRSFEEGVVTEVLRYQNGDRRVRELYKSGELVLRVYLRGEERIREQVIRDGVVVQERSFSRDES